MAALVVDAPATPLPPWRFTGSRPHGDSQVISATPAPMMPGTAVAAVTSDMAEDWQRFVNLAAMRDATIAYGSEEVEEAQDQKLIAVLFVGAASLGPGSVVAELALQADSLGGKCHVFMANNPLHQEVIRWGGVAAILRKPLRCVRKRKDLFVQDEEKPPTAPVEMPPTAPVATAVDAVPGPAVTAVAAVPTVSTDAATTTNEVSSEVRDLMSRFELQLQRALGQVASLEKDLLAAADASPLLPSARPL